MSGLPSRIGSSFRTIKTLVNRNDFKFSFKTSKGVRIAEMTSNSTDLAKNEKQGTRNMCDTEKNKELKETVQDVYVLEELVNKTARVRIHSKFPYGRWCFQKSNDQPDFELDWSDVEVIPAKPNFEPIVINEDAQAVNRVISSIMLTNRSKVSQWHKIKTERQIVSLCESSLTTGCVIGGKVGISLPAPDSLGFLAGFSLRRAKQNFDKETIAWVGTDCIKIPKGDIITVTIQSKVKQKEFIFTTLIGVKGAVYALFFNPYSQKKVKLPISIGEVFSEHIPYLKKKENDDTIFFTITGRCKFEYDMEQEIIINST